MRSGSKPPLDCQKEDRQPNVKKLKTSLPQSKRRKKGNSIPKKLGKLQRLLDSFPLEIMFEVRTIRHRD